MPREGTPVRITQSMRGRPRKVVLTVHFKGDADAVAEAQEQEKISQEEVAIPDVLPLLPIRDRAYFPHMIFPLFVGRDKSVRALEEARSQDRYILLVSQKQMAVDDPQPEDVFEVGTVAEVMQVLSLPDSTVRVMLEGVARVRVKEFLQSDPFY